MKALVTGANGFVGSALVKKLNQEGIDVFALMRKTSDASNLKGLSYQRFEGSLEDLNSLRRAVKGMDWVFHIAGVTAAANREAYFASNTQGTKNLVQAIWDESVAIKKFIYMSSLAAAGPALDKHAKRETEDSSPVSAYGESKRASEEYLIQQKDKLPSIIVRPPMVFGPKDKDVFLFVQTVAKNWMPLLKGNNPSGQKYYSIVHVDDVADHLYLSATAQVPSGETFFVCADRFYSYREIMESIARILKKKPIRLNVPRWALISLAYASHWTGKFLNKEMALNQDKVKELLPDYWLCSNQKSRELLGFRPRYDLDRGMEHAIHWYQQNGWI